MSPLSSPVCDIIWLSLFFMIWAISKHTSQIVYRMPLNLDLSQNYSGVTGLGNEYHKRWSALLSCIRGSMRSTSLSLVIWTLWYLAVSPPHKVATILFPYAMPGRASPHSRERGGGSKLHLLERVLTWIVWNFFLRKIYPFTTIYLFVLVWTYVYLF